MVMNTGILSGVHAEEYGFKIGDMTVAAMIKAYLQQIAVDTVPEQLGRIVSPGVRNIRGGKVKDLGLEREAWVPIDGAAMAALIDNARETAAISASEWKAQKGERLLKKTIEYLRDDVFPGLSGKKYVASMPVEMAEFITDCWLALEG